MFALDLQAEVFVLATAFIFHLLFGCLAATGFRLNRNRIDPVKFAATVLKIQGRSYSGETVNHQ